MQNVTSNDMQKKKCISFGIIKLTSHIDTSRQIIHLNLEIAMILFAFDSQSAQFNKSH